MNELKMKAKAGVTLVELLVVILIVTILSVSLLPLLKPYIVKAQYAAEPIPIIGNLRTQIGLYQYERDRLPGLPTKSDGTIHTAWTKTVVTDGGDSTFANLSAIQTFARIYEQNAGLAQYHHSWWQALTGDQANDIVLGASINSDDRKDLTTAKGEVTAVEDADCTVANSHFAKQLRIDYDDLTGKKIRPNMVQYRVLCGGKGGAYAYAIGVFGDGDGLPAGTGYAVIEICNPKQRIKRVGTWERYKAIDNSGKQVIFAASGTANEAGLYSDIDGNNVTPDNANESNLCFIGDPDVYLNLDGTKTEVEVQAALGDLAKAGWVFN